MAGKKLETGTGKGNELPSAFDDTGRNFEITTTTKPATRKVEGILGPSGRSGVAL